MVPFSPIRTRCGPDQRPRCPLFLVSFALHMTYQAALALGGNCLDQLLYGNCSDTGWCLSDRCRSSGMKPEPLAYDQGIWMSSMVTEFLFRLSNLAGVSASRVRLIASDRVSRSRYRVSTVRLTVPASTSASTCAMC